MNKKYDYDVVIIGAGIGGLGCGCYLAKSGLKVLIAERNARPGGYCSSFRRKELVFDTCAHSLGSCRKDGNIIITPDYKLSFCKNLEKTIQEFQDNFPKEAKKISKFFNDLAYFSNISLLSLRNITFIDLLNKYFNDNKLKAILSFPILGNAGLSVSRISAFSASTLYREFLLDGGYYPEGGMQAFSNILAMRFKEFGGNLLLSHPVKRIKIKGGKAEGVLLEKNDTISSRHVVSDCDAVQTFCKLLKIDKINNKFATKLRKMEPSLSMFILYLENKDDLKTSFPTCCNIWYLPNYDIERMYYSATNRSANNLGEFMVRTLPQKRSKMVFVNANFNDEKFWHHHEEELANNLINRVETIIPHLSKHITYRGIATPQTLHKLTLNYKGAAYGWAALPSQFLVPGFTNKTFLQNLYLTSHWTTSAHGIRGVVYSGFSTANLILKARAKNKK